MNSVAADHDKPSGARINHKTSGGVGGSTKTILLFFPSETSDEIRRLFIHSSKVYGPWLMVNGQKSMVHGASVNGHKSKVKDQVSMNKG